jgi:hypothetical protein
MLWRGGQNVTVQGVFTCDLEQYYLALMLQKQPSTWQAVR